LKLVNLELLIQQLKSKTGIISCNNSHTAPAKIDKSALGEDTPLALDSAESQHFDATSRQAALGLSGYQIPGGRRNLITHGRAEQPMKNQLLWHGKSRRNRTGPRAGTRARTLTEDSPAASEPKAEREVQGTGKSMSWPVHCNEPATATARRQDPENESF
jgi:hypothetical protein